MPGTSALKIVSNSIADDCGEYQYLSAVSKKDRPWDGHRQRAEQVQKLYSWAQREDFDRYANKISQCSEVLEFAWIPDGDGVVSLKLKSSQFCRVRHCPVCQWRKALRWQGRFLEALPKIEEEYPTARWIFLTLTQRNCEVSELKEQLKTMNKAFAKMVKWKAWPAIGWVKALEVTRNKETDQAHPHIHALMMVKGDYFGRNYINQAEWTQMWRKAMKLDYDPVVNVKAVKPRKNQKEGEHPLRGVIAEAMKYTVKPSDMVASGPWFWTLTDQLHGSRAISLGGVLPKFVNEAEPTEDEMVQGVDGEDNPEREQQTLFGVKWRVNPKEARYGRKL